MISRRPEYGGPSRLRSRQIRAGYGEVSPQPQSGEGGRRIRPASDRQRSAV